MHAVAGWSIDKLHSMQGTLPSKALHQLAWGIPEACHNLLLSMQAVAGKSRTGRRLMADNAALLNDLAELQHSNRDLARQLAAATDQLAHFTGVQFAASNSSCNRADAHSADAAAAVAAAGGYGSPGSSRPGSAALAQGRPGSGYVPAFLTAGGSRPASPGYVTDFGTKFGMPAIASYNACA
jgi:hypothetical protein